MGQSMQSTKNTRKKKKEFSVRGAVWITCPQLPRGMSRAPSRVTSGFKERIFFSETTLMDMQKRHLEEGWFVHETPQGGRASTKGAEDMYETVNSIPFLLARKKLEMIALSSVVAT